jgi:chromosome segregation ATPase
MDSKNFERDANTSNTSSSQSNLFESDRDWQERESNSVQAENLEEQLISLMALADSLDLNWQQERVEQQPVSWSQTTNLPSSSELETIDGEITFSDLEEDLSSDRIDNQTNWFEVACHLEEQNQEFSQAIAQLEQTLIDSRRQLQIQLERSLDAETIVSQQSEEIYQAHQQIADLIEQLEVSQQEVQRQQSAIATLLEQLDNSQKQVAQLEREQVLIQEDCSDRTQKLLAMEKHLRELWSRLHRQQRYTLEYKAALEECLGMSVEDALDLDLPTPPLAASEIEPWSSQQQPLTTPSKDEDREVEFEFLDIGVAPVAETSTLVRSTEQIQSLPSHEISAITWHRDRSQVKVELPSFLRTRHS